MELLLIRHGQSRANTGECTDCDCDLTALGREQAIAIGQQLTKRFDLTTFTGLCSPYRRARETARLISDGCGLSFVVDEGCREWAHGCDVDGVHYKAESADQAVARLDAFRASLDPAGRYVIVSHGSPIFILVQLCTGVPPADVAGLCVGDFWQVIHNCGLTHLRHGKLVCLSKRFTDGI